MIIEEIKSANIEALKTHDNIKRGILSVVLNKIKLYEVELKSKNMQLTEIDVISIIQKTIKELSDEKEGYLKVNNLSKANDIEMQSKTLSIYLPKQMSEEEIIEEIKKLDDKSMPSIMKHFKTNFAGKVDMSLVSKVVRGL